MKRQAQSKWTKLSDSDLAIVGGGRGRLIGKLEKRYGLPKELGEAHVDEWIGFEATPELGVIARPAGDMAPPVTTTKKGVPRDFWGRPDSGSWWRRRGIESRGDRLQPSASPACCYCFYRRLVVLLSDFSACAIAFA